MKYVGNKIKLKGFILLKVESQLIKAGGRNKNCGTTCQNTNCAEANCAVGCGWH